MISALEVAANVAATVSIVLAARNSVHTWWTGIVGCASFMLLFYESQLYADVALQAFFIATSMIGWRRWLRGDGGRPLPITHADPTLLGVAAAGGVVAVAGHGALLRAFTDAYAPFVDSAVLVFSVIAQLLLMQRRLESWLFWLVVNSIAVPLYTSRELYLTAGLYAFYWVNAVVAWLAWRRWMRPAAAASALTAG